MTARSTALLDRGPPATAPRLLLLSGSLRRDSYQRRLLEYLAAITGDQVQLDLVAPTDCDLPMFNQDLETSEVVIDRVREVHARFSSAHGFIVASPEYNGHVSPFLKNTVDWVSRLPRIDQSYQERDAFRAKPLLLASASTGWSGGLLGLRDARTLFSYLGCLVAAEQICVSDATHWTPTGRFVFEPAFASFIEQTLTRFLSLVTCLAPPPAARQPAVKVAAHV